MNTRTQKNNLCNWLLLLAAIVLLTSFTAEDKNKKIISTQKRFLTSKSWKCIGVSTHDTTFADSAFTKITMHFLPNNYYVSQYDTLVTYGKWRFNKAKSKIQLLNQDGQKITFDIVVLNSTTFNYKFTVAYNDTLTLSSIFMMQYLVQRHQKCAQIELLTEEIDTE